MINLRPYQTAAARSFIDGLNDSRSAVVVLPTGTGKTVMGLAVAKELEGPVLWLAHRKELLTQPYDACGHVWPDATRGIVKAGADEWRRDAVFASIQTACRDSRLEKLCRRSWGLVVVDEAHHAPAASYRKVLDAVGAGSIVPLLGLTATPERLDSARLDDIFGRIAYQYHLMKAIGDGYLVPPDIITEKLNIDISGVGSRGGDFSAKDLDLALMKGHIVEAVADAAERHAKGRKSLVFAISVAQSKEIKEALVKRGFRAGSIDGEMGDDERSYALRKFKSGEYDVLVNCMVLTEGFDEPSIDCIIMARPTQSKSLYIQVVGRGLRLFPGKNTCRVIDLVCLSDRHTLVQAPVLFGAEVEEPEGRDKPTVTLKSDPVEYWRQRLSTQMMGLKTISRSDMQWIRGANDELLLNVGDYGTVRLAEVGKGWLCEVVGNKVANEKLVKLTTDPVALELAQGIAEDYVRQCKAVNLAKGGRWRDQPATPAQLTALKKFGIKPPDELSKGRASDMLTQAAAKNYEPASDKQVAYLKHMGVVTEKGITKREAGRLIGKLRAG